MQKRHICRQNVEVEIWTDASLDGWGYFYDGKRVGNRWNDIEKQMHINVFELKAIYFSIKALRTEIQHKHVKLYSDNSTAVSYINNMGGIKSEDCNAWSIKIWNLCVDNEIWISCTHIAGSKNVHADAASRKFNDHLEWQLDTKIFSNICARWGRPDIDLFATRLNTQLPVYCSWNPDPYCTYVDAFTLNWSEFQKVYVFPPFSIMGRCLQKIREEEASGIVIAPLWPTQNWFTSLMELLIDFPVIIRKKKELLTLPMKDKKHPLQNKLKLVVCRVSGTISENEVFLSNLPTFSCHPGETVPKNSMTYSLKDGFSTEVKGKLIQFRQFWKK